MDRRNKRFCPRHREHFSVLFRHAKTSSHQRLRRGCSESHDDLRLDDLQFRIEPRAIRRNLARVGFLMQSTFAHGLPLEVLHRVGDVHASAVDFCFSQSPVQQHSRWADERFPAKSS